VVVAEAMSQADRCSAFLRVFVFVCVWMYIHIDVNGDVRKAVSHSRANEFRRVAERRWM